MSSTPFTVTSGKVSTIRSRDDFTHFQREALASDRTMVVLFTSAWHPPCKQMRAVCDTLAVEYPSLLFCEIDAEEVSDVTEEYSSVESVPTTILHKPNQIGTHPKVIDTIPGANVNELKNAVAQHAKSSGKSPAAGGVASTASTAAATAGPAAPAETPEELNARLAKLVRASPVMIFIKGTPDAPRCGFTKQLLAILKEQQVQFGSFDILSDQTVRDGLKTFSNWPTYPQVYINGELIGGLDVVKELIAGGEFVEMIPAGHVAVPVASGNLQDRLKSLINQHRIMLFMKGSPNAPQCGFSSKAVEMLKEAGVDDYGHFDIFSDEEVREGLKEYSNWPTYPQLYVNGELIGGLDIMKELKENGELASTLEAPPALEK